MILPSGAINDQRLTSRTEANVIIYAACIPTLRPIVKRSVEIIHSTVNSKRSFFDSQGTGQHIKLQDIEAGGASKSRDRDGKSLPDPFSSNGGNEKLLPPDRIARSVKMEVEFESYGRDL